MNIGITAKNTPLMESLITELYYDDVVAPDQRSKRR